MLDTCGKDVSFFSMCGINVVALCSVVDIPHCRKDVSAFTNCSHLAVSSVLYVFLSEMSRPSKSP
jgi:hypothetical protein